MFSFLCRNMRVQVEKTSWEKFDKLKTGELWASSIHIVNNYVYFPSFKWLRSKFEKKVQRRSCQFWDSNQQPRWKPFNCGWVYYQHHWSFAFTFSHTMDNCFSTFVFSRSSLNWWKLWSSCHRTAIYSEKNIIAKCNEKSIKHNCGIENEVK